jgi:quercetin dioxygenase-like cupin family protein
LKKLTIRGVRIGLVTAGLAGTLTIVNVLSVAATPPSGLTQVLLARGTNQSGGTLPLQAGTDVVMSQITVVPGGSSGWHSHPGGAVILVQTGELTVYRSIGSRQATVYTAGQAFIERNGEVDQVVNTGTTPYVLFVTFPRVPQGQTPRIDLPDPGTCPGV